MYFLQRICIVTICDTKIDLFRNNQTNTAIWTDIDLCLSSYNSFGFQFLFNQVGQSITFVIIHKSDIILIIMVCLFVYAYTNSSSGPGATLRSSVNAVRHDIKEALKEIWWTTQRASIQLSSSITMIKLIKLFIIGVGLSVVPDVLNFPIKILVKIAEI